LLEKVTDEAVVTVQRGGSAYAWRPASRCRRRGTALPARGGAISSGGKEIQIVSRTVTEMRVTVAAEWVPATLLWNGLTLRI
jgi:hypothetical protein